MTPAPYPPEQAGIEDLDPEPPRPAARLRLEWLLGLVVLLGVLGFAGADWWRQEYQVSSYQAGLRAAAAAQWDAARAAFVTAGDYQDAPQRARNAAATIAQRDQAYTAAQAALAREDMLVALDSLRVVDRLQPGYRDTAALLARVTPGIYSAALSGTIALRPKANPPGLYTYNAARQQWQWLPNSDQASNVRYTNPAGYIIYDGPGAPGTTRRVLFQTVLGATPGPPQRLALDAAGLQILRAGPGGVWASGPGATASPPGPPLQGYIPSRLAHQDLGAADLNYLFQPSWLAYQAPGAADVNYLRHWSQERWLVMDLAADGAHYLLADLADASRSSPYTRLSRATAADNSVRPLSEIPGLLLRARFSPDGRRVVLVSRQMSSSQGLYTVRLLDVTPGGAAPTVYTQTTEPAGAGGTPPAVSAAFLRRGPRAGQVVVFARQGAAATLRLYDPAHPEAGLRPLWSQSVGPGGQVALMETPGDAGLSLVWIDPDRPNTTNALTYIDAQDRAILLTAGSLHEQLYAAWLRGDYLLFLSAGPSPDRPQTDSSALYIRSLPLAALPHAIWQLPGERAAAPVDLGAATQIYKVPPLLDSVTSLPLNLGAGLFAGLEADGLHIRTYDGAHDLLLEPDVSRFYTPSMPLNQDAFIVLP